MSSVAGAVKLAGALKAQNVPQPTLVLFRDRPGSPINGVERLAAALTINSTTVLPTVRYTAGQGLVDTSDWRPWGYGENLDVVVVATSPTISEGSPYLGPFDDSVLFNASDYYQAANNTLGNVATNDVVIELIFRATGTTTVILAKRNAGVGYEVGIDASDRLYFTLQDSGGSTAVVSAALTAGVQHHAILFVDRSGSAQWYIDGAASGSAVDVSSRSATLNAAVAFTLGADSGGAGNFDSRLCYAALWNQSGWLDTHLQATVAAQRFDQVSGIYPIHAEGTYTPTVKSRASVAHIDKPHAGTRRIFLVGSGAMRCCERLDSNSETLKGYLPEPQITNLVLRSEEIDNAAWTKTRCSITNTSTTTLPNGDTSSNDVIHEDATASDTHFISSTTINFTSGTKYVVSFWLSAINRNWARVSVNNNGTTVSAFFDITSGAGAMGTTANVTEANIVDYGGGLFRCWFSWTHNATESRAIDVNIADADNSVSFNGLNQDSIYCWGAQVEAGVDYPTTYIPTAAAAVVREEDLLQYDASDGNIGATGSLLTGQIEMRTLIEDFDVAVNTLRLLTLSDGGSASLRIGPYVRTSEVVSIFSINGAASGESFVVGSDGADGQNHSHRFRWGNGVLMANTDSVDGNTVVADDIIPANLDRFDVGSWYNGTLQPRGLLANIVVRDKPSRA